MFGIASSRRYAPKCACAPEFAHICAKKQSRTKSLGTNIGTIPNNMPTNFELKRLKLKLDIACPDARERAGPVFPPPPCVGEEETQAQRARARRDKDIAKLKPENRVHELTDSNVSLACYVRAQRQARAGCRCIASSNSRRNASDRPCRLGCLMPGLPCRLGCRAEQNLLRWQWHAWPELNFISSCAPAAARALNENRIVFAWHSPRRAFNLHCIF